MGTILLLLTASLISQGVAEPKIATVAGTGRQGFDGDGGLAARALLNQPFDVAIDSRGDLYFSDTFNHRIRKIDRATGIIATVAGSGQKGFAGDGGPAILASINEPYGVALDTSGNLYFVDRLNGRVRKVDGQTGIISTVAGTGQKLDSGDDGPADRAGLVEPNGVALDPRGPWLFIADVAGHRIRRVDLKTGMISAFAGTGRGRHAGDGGSALLASIWGARAVEVGEDGTVYILEREGNSLRSVNPTTGLIGTVAGTGAKGYSGDGGPAALATFNGPKELAVDRAGNLLIVDTENHAIRFIDSSTGIIRTVAGTGRAGGSGDGGLASLAQLDRPHGVAVGRDGTFWIADTNNHRVRVVSPALKP
jgi:sugar lactone lactonase YvrE